ncbi:aldehyde dehydrogenase family protein [Paracidovorax oryzae]|uniref:aldehyde dehydrogenase family protein n=1 Tax=Paracidovorax oryzae TaxID=862720 RepID=UPI0002F4DB22|nr:aldehyde dehydrogenase family protein [Paracidovorax oryzae]
MGSSEHAHLAWARPECWDGAAFDGGWSTRLAGREEVIEPATGQPLWGTGIADAADMQAAIGRAHAAQPAWAAAGPRERAAILFTAAGLFERHLDELALAIARETGGILPKGQLEAREAATLCRIAGGGGWCCTSGLRPPFISLFINIDYAMDCRIRDGGFKSEVQHLPTCKVRRCTTLPAPATTANCSPKTGSPLPA